MSGTDIKFRMSGQQRQKSTSPSNASEDSSDTYVERETPKHQQEKTKDTLLWNYVAFTPSNDPKHNNGTRATVYRTNPSDDTLQQQTRAPRNSSKSYLEKIGKKRPRRSANDSSSDSEGPPNDNPMPTRRRRKPARKITLPLLRNPFQLKYMLEGHAHLGQHLQPKKQKKPKNKKKGSSSKHRQQQQQPSTTITTDPDAESDNNTDEDSSDDEGSPSFDIWSCEFEPSKDMSSSTTTVALCGGSSILFLDTQQGRYVKKYSHPEPLECFYTLAWTLLQGSQQLGRMADGGSQEGGDDDDDRGSNHGEKMDVDDDTFATILAAAGKFGSIKLLEPTQSQCYRYLFGHQRPVLKLNFSKKEPRWLLSSSMDMTVRLWDIGTPSNETDDSSCLAHFNIPGSSHPTSMCLSYDQSLLVVGTNKADLLQYAIDKSHIKSWQRDTYKTVPTTKSTKNDKNSNRKSHPTIIKPKLKFPHGEEWHDGYVEDVYILGQDGTENGLTNYVVSRGSEDMEIVVWNPKRSTQKDADIHLSLEWPESNDCTGMRFSVVEKDGQKLIIGGDHDGDIRLYNIGDGKFSKTLDDGSKELFDPLQVFTHEASTHLIRDVCVSLDTRKFVAVDSNNTVFIWSCN